MRTQRRTKAKLIQRSRLNQSHSQYVCTNKGQGQEKNAPKLPSSSRLRDANLHALPVELLAHIFTFCTEVPEDQSLPYPAWLPVTRVCRYWRAIALSHGPLWTSITPGLSLHWIKVFIERSRTSLMDFDIRVGPTWPNIGISHEDIILLLTDFMRVRSLRLTGSYFALHAILRSLRSSLPIESLSLCDFGWQTFYYLHDDWFGGKASIRRLHLAGGGHIVVPQWLLRGVTHFTSGQLITLPYLLNVLTQMPALVYFEFRTRRRWIARNMDELRASPVQMPQLMNLVVSAVSPDEFVILNQVLLLHVDAKRRIELPSSAFHSGFSHTYCIDDLLTVVGATDRLQHIHFSGTQKEGWFRLWTGDAVTTWEDAEFCLYAEWRAVRLSRENLRDLFALCDVLGAARVRRLVIDSLSPTLPKSYWWKLLENLPGIEELELYPASVDVLGSAWKVNRAPAVLPALRRVRIMDRKLDNPSQYAIIGDPLARRIVQLPAFTEDDVTPSPEMVSAEKELEGLSKGLLRLLRGSAGRCR
ncbi:hypothetical protein EDB84DRAFT_1464963 [Lactarius hengduanensis]|nr:hypothetical protein EDB84DRAFT_1464963 [Lactarius hengduanensis]